ncbi:MAG: lysoplasmalogenase family protein, partial [Vicinamibacterales bacterium]
MQRNAIAEMPPAELALEQDPHGRRLAADVALLWPTQGFLPGLVSFLFAHLAYLVAFTRHQRFGAWWPAFAAYALV